MNFDHQFEVGDAHLVKDCIAQNARADSSSQRIIE
jgi:hypothetical protein